MPRGPAFLFTLILFLGLAVGCGPAATPTATPTRRPTRTPFPTLTPKPTDTVVIPTATPLPSDTPAPTDVPSSTPTPPKGSGGSAAVAPAGSGTYVWTMAPLIDYFSKIAPPDQPPIARAANIDPLTGLAVSDPSLLQRRAVLGRVGNDPSSRDVHAGFNQADLVFEEMIDQHNMVFGTTRYTLVFLGQNGVFRPLRSARAVNASLVPMFDGILMSSGGSRGTRFMISQLPWKDRNLDGDLMNQTICITPGDYRVHVATSVEHVEQYAASKGQAASPTLRGFQFSDAAPGGTPITSLSFDHSPWPYRAAGTTEWRYDPASGKYKRFVNGAPHNTQNYTLDGTWGKACDIGNVQTEQIAASNVVVLNVKYAPTDFVEDTLNSYSAFLDMLGTGTAAVYRDGVKIDATWERPTLSDFFVLKDASGNEIGLKPGNTWFELAPTGYKPTEK